MCVFVLREQVTRNVHLQESDSTVPNRLLGDTADNFFFTRVHSTRRRSLAWLPFGVLQVDGLRLLDGQHRSKKSRRPFAQQSW